MIENKYPKWCISCLIQKSRKSEFTIMKEMADVSCLLCTSFGEIPTKYKKDDGRIDKFLMEN